MNDNETTRRAWEANAAHWDATMGDAGNDFVNLLIWPVTRRLLDPKPGQRVLDVACGNGLYARRVAELGADVVGFDFSAALIERARARAAYGERLAFHVVDATDSEALLTLGEAAYDAAMCNMALFDIADVEPLAAALARLLRPDGRFVFSVMHPSFNGKHATLVAETTDDGREIRTRYAVRLSRYLTPFTAQGIAIRGQPEPQLYFHRPLGELLRPFLRAGFVLNALEEPAFPPVNRPDKHTSWSGNYSEFPPALVARLIRQ